jgi:tRNA U38,U39,U40 pseudouridine synthase TruA
MVGAMMDVARKRVPIDAIADYRDARDRSLQSTLAPAHGLILNRVSYTNGLFASHTAY